MPQAFTVVLVPSNRLPSITKVPPCSVSSPPIRIGGTCRSWVERADHHPLEAIWSAERNDETSSPTVGNSQSATRSATDRCTAHVRPDFLPTMLAMSRPPQRISLRALCTFQIRIGSTSSMMIMALAEPTPQSKDRNSLSYM